MLPLIDKPLGMYQIDAPPEVGVGPYFRAVSPFRLENVTAIVTVSPLLHPAILTFMAPRGGVRPL